MSRKGHYPGGSTIVRGPRPKYRLKPQKAAAIDVWIADAAEAGIEMPPDIKLKPIQRFRAKVTSKGAFENADKQRRHSPKKQNSVEARFKKPDAESRAENFRKFAEQIKFNTRPEVKIIVPTKGSPKSGK